MLGISKRAERYEGSPIRRISSMLEKAGNDKSIISFGGGAPSLAPPKEVIDYVVEKLKAEPQHSTAYTSTPGPTHTRELISEDLKREEGVNIPAEEIILTIGGTEALYVAFQTLINPGDEVLTTDPAYLGYNEPIKLAGGVKKTIPIYWKENFQIKEERLKEAITSKTKAMILISPDNPTGAVQEEKNLKAIVEICEDKGIWLITDDIYKHIVFEGKFINTRKFGGYENTISLGSFSKSASIPGVRIGYAYGPKEVIKKISELKQATSLTAPKLATLFIDKFLENNAEVKKKYLSEIVVPTYKERRDYMGEMLKKYTDLEFATPQGAFYYFIDISREDEKFSDELLKENIVVIPGKYFGEKGKNHIRLTFVSETKERIEKGIKKIGEKLAH